MHIKAIVFDANGTLIDIRTEEESDEAFRAVGHVLTYHGISLRRRELRPLYFSYLKQQKADSQEHHPEYDVIGIWRRIVDEHATDFTRSLPSQKLEQLPQFLAETHRGVSRRRLRLFPHVRSVLTRLREEFPLALVSDAQSIFARGELHQVGLTDYFGPVVISGDHGYRKPDRRLFGLALDQLGVNAENALYVGNDMYRDIHGATRIGMKTAMFCSGQGRQSYRDVQPDHYLSDHRDLLSILGLDGS